MSVLTRKDTRAPLLSLFTVMHGERPRQKAGETPTVYKPGGDFSLDTETGPDGNLDLGLPASRP